MREWLSRLPRAADLFSDEEILALDEDGAMQLVERLVVSRWCCSSTTRTSRSMDRRERRFLSCRSRVIPISSSLTRDRCGHDRALGARRDRWVVSLRTPCTSSSRIRRGCRRATKWFRLDSLPCGTMWRVCDQRLSGSKQIYVMSDCGHLTTVASKPKSVAGPSPPIRRRDGAADVHGATRSATAGVGDLP